MAKGKAQVQAGAATEAVDLKACLIRIVGAGAEGTHTPAFVHDPLVEEGLVEINLDNIDADGNVATRATQKGIDQVNNTATVTKGPAAAKPSFEIQSDVPMPTVSGRGRSGSVYPFEQLEIGQSFFVADVEGKPKAGKTMASTVSGANARYSVPSSDGATKTNKNGEQVPVMVPTRHFVLRSVVENGVSGARVWRQE